MTKQTELLREAVETLRGMVDANAAKWDMPHDEFCTEYMAWSKNRARAFLAKIDAAEVDESEFQVISGNEEDACIEAATSGPRDVALREAMRYAHQYAEDGPVKVVELVTVAMLPAARRQESE